MHFISSNLIITCPPVLKKVFHMGISYSLYHVNRMLNSTQSINLDVADNTYNSRP